MATLALPGMLAAGVRDVKDLKSRSTERVRPDTPAAAAATAGP